MSEKKTVEQLKQAYSQLCLRAGDIQYKLRCNQRDLDLLQSEMQRIDLEYVQAVELAKRVDDEVAKKAAKEDAGNDGEVKS